MLLEGRSGRRQRLLIVARQLLADLFLPRQRLVPCCRHAARRCVQARGDAFQQAGRALLEGLGESIQRRAQMLRERLARSLVPLQCFVPDARDGGGGRLESAREPIQLPLHGVRDGVVQRGRLARETRHRGRHDRLQRRAGGAGAFGDALLQRLLHGRSKARIGGLGLAVEGVLAGDLPLVQGEALLLDGRHHRLQTIDQRGHHLGLPLQELEAFLALMGLRVDAQGRRDLHVEHLRGIDPLAPAQRRKQPQHRGGGHARNRRAEREAQSLDRCGERIADSLQVRRAFQRHAGAAQGRHHAEERAEHAQQHEQADQIRRQRRARQGHALTLDAQAHRIAQAGMQGLEPGAQAGRRPGQARDRTRQRGRGLAVAPQFERARHVADANQQRDRQRQRIRADVAATDPAHRGQTYQKNNEIEISGHSVPVSRCEGRRAALRPVVNEHPVRPATRSAYPCGTCSAMRRVWRVWRSGRLRRPPRLRRRPASVAPPARKRSKCPSSKPGHGGQQTPLALAERSLHHGVHHREPGHGGRSGGQHGPQAAAQGADARLHRLLHGEVALTKNRVIDRRIRRGALRERLRRRPATPRGGKHAIADDGIRQRRAHAGALALFSVAEGARAGGDGRRSVVQRRGQRDRVGPAEPLA